MRKFNFLVLMAGLAQSVWAARPFVTDDARLTTEGSCQLESWGRSYSESREFWALPACNPGGNLELTLGGGWARYDNGPATKDQVFQLKTLFKPVETGGWGWGLAVGTVHHPDVNPGPNLLGNTYVYAPLTASFLEDRAMLHVNAGLLRDRATRRTNATWGLGGEYVLDSRVSAIAETFGDNRSKPYWQTGARFFVVPNLFQVDATAGQQFSGSRASRWISIGIRLTPDKLF